MAQLNSPAEKIKADGPHSKKDTRKKPRPPKKITESYLQNSGMYYLERFAASTGHFKSVMMRKINKSCDWHKDQDRESCIAMLDRLVETLQAAGLLNDEHYARGMVISLRRRGLSARMIQARLKAKGLGSDHIHQALQEHAEDVSGDADLTAALRLAQRKKIGPYRKTADMDEKSYNKALGVFARAGYSYDICQKIMGMEHPPNEFGD
ncbi:MAG: regulatory protein RecX [Rhodospirillales bacterium]|nr:regulatory protein RecX [Rhodospirillales bacterium]MCB9995454.1 regulatory protein RecX [Rhodospirillales bacterium]